MRRMTRYMVMIFVNLLFSISATAQPSYTTDDNSVSDWSFEFDILHYFFKDEADITTLIGIADHDKLHLESRYNYEGLNSVSLFAGYRFAFEGKFSGGVTPIGGFVAGHTQGLIPGLELDIAWKKLDFYSESEFVIDLEDDEGNYFYTWCELAITAVNNLRTGIAGSRTRLYHSDLDLQRSGFAEYTVHVVTAGIHYFNPFTDDDFVLLTAALNF